MEEIEIARNQWWQFCEMYSRQHLGWLVGLRQLASERVHALAPETVPLYPGYRALQEVREGEQGEQVEVMVTVAEGTQATSFLIADAVALYIRSIGDADLGLRIDSGNGKSTLLEFRAVAEPASLDGFVEAIG